MQKHLKGPSMNLEKEFLECHELNILVLVLGIQLLKKSIEFTNALKLEPLQTHKINTDDFQSMLDWVAQFGRSVRQRSGRQEKTMTKSRALPEGYYQPPEQLEEDVDLDA